MLGNNIIIESIYFNRKKMYFEVADMEKIEVISEICIQNNQTKELNSIKVIEDFKENIVEVNLEELAQYLNIDEEVQIKSKIELIDEIYYLPITTTINEIFPIEIYRNNKINLILKKDKNNFLSFEKRKVEKVKSENVNGYIISNFNLKENNLYLGLLDIKNDLKVKEFYLLNRINKEKRLISFEKKENLFKIKIDLLTINEKEIYDFELIYLDQFEKKYLVKRINLLNNFKEINKKNIKVYKTKNNNLALYINDKNYYMKNDLLKLKLIDIKGEKNEIFLTLESDKNIGKENLKIKSRNNFIRYNGILVNKKNNQYIFKFKIKDFNSTKGIYDFKIYKDEKPLALNNKNIIISPIYVFNHENILRIRPYLTLDGNLAIIIKKKIAITAFLEKIDIKKNYIELSINIYKEFDDMKIINTFIDENNYIKNLTINKEKFISNKIKLPFNFLDKLNEGIHELNFRIKLKNTEIITKIMIVNQSEIIKNDIINQKMINNKNIEIITNNMGLLAVKNQYKNMTVLSSIISKKNSYEMKFKITNLNNEIYASLKDIHLKSGEKIITIVGKNQLEKKQNDLYIMTTQVILDNIQLEENSSKEITMKFNNENYSIEVPIICEDLKLMKKFQTFKSNARKVSDNKHISLYISNKNKKVYLEKRLLKDYEKLNEIIQFNIIKSYSNMFNKKSIWLIGENLGEIAQDNGFAFFKYCIDNNLKKDIYYITKENNKNMENLKPYEKNLIYYDSFKHKVFYNKAEYLIVAHGIRDVMPSVLHNKLAFNNKEIIYLQHGITAMKKIFFNKNSYNGKIKKFLVCSDFEKEILVKKMNFDEKQILISGFPRFDYLADKRNEKDSKKIIFMPTWREWLIDSEESVINSKFYKGYKKLFTNERFNKIIEENNIKVDFVFHINMEKFKDQFKFILENKNINLIDLRKNKINELIHKGDLWITDYSSIVLDFNYLGKPSIFFQPDLEEYLDKRGSFVDFDNDLVGTRCTNEVEFIDSLEDIISSNFKYLDKYEKNSRKYYKYRDNKNCERIYNAIINLKKVGDI